MKKNLVLTLCLSLILTLVGCTSNDETNKSTQTTNNQKEVSQPINDQKEEAQTTNNQNDISQPISGAINKSEEIAKASSKVKLYEGTYFDDKCFGENQLKNYCEVEISNIANTSFDFTVYEVKVADGKKDKKVIFNKNTAFFIEDGMKATFKGKEYSLNFTFPNNHKAFPAVTDMKISGFKQLEGNTYVNNKIPGHEFG